MKTIQHSPAGKNQSGRKAFTLIELLVVIAIIAILMGLLFPAVSGALNQARRASAKNDVVQIANAVVMYETEYGKLPPSAGGTVKGKLLDALMATQTNDNPRKIVILEAPDFKRNKGGVTSGSYKDPWSNDYQIKMDTDYENKIDVTQYTDRRGGSKTVKLRKRVGVWTSGEDANVNPHVFYPAHSWE
ncbi:MAG: type II secretion system protein [Chthoniobacterales bacterium]